MTQVSYEGDKNAYSSIDGHKQSLLTRFIIKSGIVKSESGATAVMVGVIILSCAVMWFIWAPSFKKGETIYREDLTPEELQTLPEDIINSLPSRGS